MKNIPNLVNQQKLKKTLRALIKGHIKILTDDISFIIYQ